MSAKKRRVENEEMTTDNDDVESFKRAKAAMEAGELEEARAVLLEQMCQSHMGNCWMALLFDERFHSDLVDSEEARTRLRQRAEQGNSPLAYLCGMMHLQGSMGFEHDEEAGVQLLLSASDEVGVAKWALAGCYSNGEGVPQDEAVGLEWMEQCRGPISQSLKNTSKLLPELMQVMLSSHQEKNKTKSKRKRKKK